jgi:hypothetical protein
MQQTLATFEFLVWALFAIFIAIQAGMLCMIALARILKSVGLIQDGSQRRGFLGFLEGFS